MESRIKIAGHPLHPMLIVFPLGLLATAVAFDIAALISTDNSWFNISFWIMAAGILGGLLAALPGLIDWVAIPSNTRAKWHGDGNVAMVVLFAMSWSLRRGNAGVPSSGALMLSFLGLVLALITGWLGGRIGRSFGGGCGQWCSSGCAELAVGKTGVRHLCTTDAAR